MRRKIILCLMIIGLTSFNLIGCSGNAQKNSQDSNQSKETDQLNNEANPKSTDKVNDNSNNNEEKNQGEDKKVSKDDTGNNKLQESKKQIYKDKLDNIQLGLKDLEGLYAGNTVEMKSAASQEYERWDKALNEIYGVLKQQLSSDEMNKLKEEEIKWISDRDNKAKKESLVYEGGTAEPLAYTQSLAKTTKDRCYELVEKYMK